MYSNLPQRSGYLMAYSRRMALRIAVVILVGLIALSRKPPIVAPSPTPSPAPTEAFVTISPPTGWVYYSHPELSFSAYIPEGWEVQVHATEKDNPLRGVSFGAGSDAMPPDATVITVMALPLIEAGGKGALSRAELKEAADSWAKKFQLYQLLPMEEVSIGNHPAVMLVYENEASDKSYKLRGYAAFLSTPQWLFHVQAVGLASYAQAVKRTYDTFVNSFSSPPRAETPRPFDSKTPTPKPQSSVPTSQAGATSIFDWSKDDGQRLAVTVGPYLRDMTNYTTEEFIIAAEQAARQFSNEWVVYYSLCDKYQSAKRYNDGMRVCRDAYVMRPNDVRSAYALGTMYNILTRAAWGPREIEAISAYLRENPDAAAAMDISDPWQEQRLAEAALRQSKMSIQDAARYAIDLFEHVLSLSPDSESSDIVRKDLDTLYGVYGGKAEPRIQANALTASNLRAGPSGALATLMPFSYEDPKGISMANGPLVSYH